MKRIMWKKSAAFMTAFVLLFSGMNFSAFISLNGIVYAAEEAGTDIPDEMPEKTEVTVYEELGAGKEDNVSARLIRNDGEEETYTLKIMGTGKMKNQAAKYWPWYTAAGNNKKITGIEIEEGITHIGDYAFQGHNAACITLPADVESIGTYALRVSDIKSCKINIQGMNTSIETGITKYPFTSNKVIITCFEGSRAEETLKKATGTKYKELIVEKSYEYGTDGVTVNKYLATGKQIVIPDTITAIGTGAFLDYSRLENITFNNVTDIGENAFKGCTNLKSVIILPQVTVIGDEAFQNETVIYGKRNSPADVYAVKHGNPFYNLLPERKDTAEAETVKTIVNGVEDTINLKEIFTIKYETELSYLVSVEGSAYQEIDGNVYHFIRQENGQYTLEFKAKDSWGDCSEETYRITYTVKNNDRPKLREDISVSEEGYHVLGEEIVINLSEIFTDMDGDELTYKVSVNGAKMQRAEEKYTYCCNQAGRTELTFMAADTMGAESETYTYEINGYALCVTPLPGADIDNVEKAVFKLVRVEDGQEIKTDRYDGSYYADLEINQTYQYTITMEDGIPMEKSFTWDGEGRNETIKISKVNHLLATSMVDAHAAEGSYGYDPDAEHADRAWNTILTGTTAWDKYIGLGGFGGYITIFYEQGIKDDEKNPYGIDFIVYGNAFGYGNGSGGEPAGVKVSEDGETWYELAGSAHYETETLLNQPAITKDGTQTTATLIARMGEAGISTVVPAPLTVFGYGDVHCCSGNKNAEGDSKVSSIAGNPYSELHESNIGDGFDLKWAVDEWGIPVDVSGKEFHYIRIQNVVDIDHPTYGTNSPEIGTVSRAISSDRSVGVTKEPDSIKINGIEYRNETPVSIVNGGTTKYYTINLNDTQAAVLNVEVEGNTYDNIYINKERFTATANYAGLLKNDGSRMVRIIVQNGEKEPVIYVFSITGGGNPAKNADLSSVTLTPGDVMVKSAEAENDTFIFHVANNVEKIVLMAETLHHESLIRMVKAGETEEQSLQSGKTSEAIPVAVGENVLKLTVTSPDGSVTKEYTVKIVRGLQAESEENCIKVSFTLTGDTAHGCDAQGNPNTGHEKQTWIEETEVKIPKGSTVKYLTDIMLYNAGILFDDTKGSYISKILIPKQGVWLGEFDNGANSGWMYRHNGQIADEGYAIRKLEEGDIIEWFYTDDYTREISVSPIVKPAPTPNGNASDRAYAIYLTTGKKLIETVKNPAVASIGGEWTVLGLARAGFDVPCGYYDEYYRNVVSYVRENINDSEQLHRSRSTDNSRVILALTSIGYDVTNVGGHNLLKGLTDMNYLNRQGINGPIFALIAFDSLDYEIPTAKNGEKQVTREKLIDAILSRQLPGGGWNLSDSETYASPDITAMAVQALAPYYDTDIRVMAAVDKAVEVLSAMQDETGGFSDRERASSESAAQVIVALTSLGINPKSDARFIKNGYSVLDALCTYYAEGGGFRHVADGETDGMASEQGYYALAAYFRFIEGKTRLYDMTDVSMHGKEWEGVTGKPEDESGWQETGTNKTASPSTKDNTNATGYVVMMTAMVAVLLFTFKKRYDCNQNDIVVKF